MRLSFEDIIDVQSDEGILELEMKIRKASAKKTISIDSRLLMQISDPALKQAHIEHLREDLGLSESLQGDRSSRSQRNQSFEEVFLTVTDWDSRMPETATDILVEFLASRSDDSQVCLVHLDLHGTLPRLLSAMLRNRAYFESAASSVETLELSLENVDPLDDFLPRFPNLCALRMYRPEFPFQQDPEDLTDQYSMRLLHLNCQSLQDIAIVGLHAGQQGIFSTVLRSLACGPSADMHQLLWLSNLGFQTGNALSLTVFD